MAGVVAAAVSVVAAPVSATSAAGAGTRHGSFSSSTRINNRYYPLVPETRLVYKGFKDGQPAVDLFDVTEGTKVINKVRCRAIHDRLFLRGRLVEDTVDWFAQDRAGTVWYFGEATRELDGHGHVISTEGSWRAGVDGARQGVFMPAHPRVGAVFQQEFAKSAQDRFQILSLRASVRVPFGTFRHALKTKETTPLEPGVVSDKYFVKGIGTVREVDVRGGDEQLDLVNIIVNDDDDD
jgi:hypothetical protein